MARVLAVIFPLLLLSLFSALSADEPSNSSPQTSNPKAKTSRCPPADRPPAIRRKSIIVSPTSDRYAEGRLESWPGAAILRLYGSPREMGYQHGTLLKGEIIAAVAELGERRGMAGAMAQALAQGQGAAFLPRYYAHWPEWLREEARGLAEGAEIPLPVVVWLNIMYARMAGEIEKEPEPVRGLFSGEVPRFVVAIYHPDGAPRYAAVVRAGGVGAIGGMRESGCCLTSWTAGEDRRAEFKIDGKRLQSQSQTSARQNLAQGLCGGKPEEVREECLLDSFALGREMRIRFLAGQGLICLYEPDRAPLAVDIMAETLAEECALCVEEEARP